MISIIKKGLGIEPPHPEIQFYLDCANISIARISTFVVMIMEVAAFINTFFYKISDNVADPSKWLIYHRALYIFLFLSASQLFIYSISHKPERGKFSRFKLDFSIFVFILSLLIFAICITINDYIHNEQILVFITIELFVACLFMIKPYIATFTIIISFSVFYYLMKIYAGVSSATKINYTVIMLFFILVNIIRYQQYLKIARSNVVNHALAEQLRQASLYDFLTKLKNRNALNMDFEDSDNNRFNASYIVMMIDIDNFKLYNDSKGHNFGDKLLKRFACILQQNFGKEYCYRFGGDEFLIIIPELSEEDFTQKIKSCEEEINGEFYFSGGYVKGLITKAEDLQGLITAADEKLYKAKDAGRNMVIGNIK